MIFGNTVLVCKKMNHNINNNILTFVSQGPFYIFEMAKRNGSIKLCKHALVSVCLPTMNINIHKHTQTNKRTYETTKGNRGKKGIISNKTKHVTLKQLSNIYKMFVRLVLFLVTDREVYTL